MASSVINAFSLSGLIFIVMLYRVQCGGMEVILKRRNFEPQLISKLRRMDLLKFCRPNALTFVLTLYQCL